MRCRVGRRPDDKTTGVQPVIVGPGGGERSAGVGAGSWERIGEARGVGWS